MALVTGVTRINVTDHSAESVSFTNLITGVTIDAFSSAGTATAVTAGLADATGSTDTQTFIVGADSADDNVALTMADVETINISSDTADQVDLSLAGISMTAATATNTVNFTGTNDIELMATGADIATINASGMGTGGAIVQTGRTSANASTYTGSSGNDTFIMMNSGDVLDGGAGTGDTLDINMTQAVGTAIIDLTAADQIASFNGGANTVVQTGFEHVDLAGLLTNGAVLTGTATANTLTGSGLVDQIDGGAGGDTITGGVGNDVLTGGAGDDSFVFNAAATNGADTIVDFVVGATADALEISAVDSDLNATLKVATLSADGSTLTDLAGGGTAAAGDVDVIIHLDTANLSNTGAAKTENNVSAGAITDSDGSVHVFFNTTSSKVEVYHNTNESAAGGTFTLLATLDGLVAGDIASIVTADFS
jgi:Ca2+-binding RTX toxin-like protein